MNALLKNFRICRKCRQPLRLPDMLTKGNVNISGSINLGCRCGGKVIVKGFTSDKAKKQPQLALVKKENTVEFKTEVKRQVAILFTTPEEPDFNGAVVLSEEDYNLLSPEALDKLQVVKLEEWRKARSPQTEDEAKVAAEVARVRELENIAQMEGVLAARKAELSATE